MKLDAFDAKLAVAHAHDLAVFALGRDLETRRQAGAFDHQRMIARRRERAREALKDAVAAMRHPRELAVHDAAGSYDASTECLADRLMAEAHAEDRYLAREALDERHADARFRRRARPRRQDDLLRLPCGNL